MEEAQLMAGNLDFPSKEEHAQVVQSQVDKAIILATAFGDVGWHTPNEFVAEYVEDDPDKLTLFLSVDPHDPEAYEELKHAYFDL